MLSFFELVSGLTTPAVHPARAAQIAAINANSSLTWRAAANARFAFQPPGASRSSNGVLGDWAADIRAAVARGDVAHYVPADATLALPESFDSEEHWKECAKVIGDIYPRPVQLRLLLGVCRRRSRIRPHVHRHRRQDGGPALSAGRSSKRARPPPCHANAAHRASRTCRA